MAKDDVKPEHLAPRLQEGFTQGVPAEEALSYFESPTQDGVAQLRALRDVSPAGGTRVPTPRFVASVSDDSIMVEPATGRVMQDVELGMNPETRRAIQAGSICLRCLEPQPSPFPTLCDLCGYPMAERQAMDVAVEFEGEIHLGPTRPISEFLEEQSERLEKRKFMKRILDGGKGKIPKSWLRDSTLMEGLDPVDRKALG